ncbi:hypothetical protein [Hyalangium gracile]|uniref:hypothetical protein n=1 Tax=Hyalangium gracile TaxID=394092 RepID=UPI001CD03F07|nr:hypothetical protein [Hyalangium gracile]
MKVACVLLMVVLSGAGPASASQSPESTDAPRQPLSTPPLVPANDAGELIPRQESSRRKEPGFLSRAGIGLLGGMGGGLVGAGGGALMGHLLAQPAGCERKVCAGAQLSGAYVGALFGVPAGTYFASRYSEGRGSYVSALAGSMVGWGAVAVGQFVLLSAEGISEADPDDAFPLAVLLTLPALGSTLGYQLSHSLSPQRTYDDDAWVVGRVLLELLFGSVGGAAGAVGGFVGGVGASNCPISESCISTGDELILNSVTFASLTVGSVLGVYGAGVLFRSRGGFLPTLVGGVLGGGMGGLVLATLESDWSVLVIATAPLVGAIIGYEVSNAFAESEAAPAVGTLRPATSLEVLPVVAATPSGGILGGVVGRF